MKLVAGIMPTFNPPWWLRNPHLQTVWPTLFRRSRLKFKTKRQRFELRDGDFIDLDWTPKQQGPIIIVLHGLEGSIVSPYSRGVLNVIYDANWTGVFMNFRCCSGELNRFARSYHSGDTQDLTELIDYLKQRFPNAPLAAVGFSLGGNVLLKYLGEFPKNQLAAAVAVSVPFEISKVADRVNTGFSKIYQWLFLQNLTAKIQKKIIRHPALLSLPNLKKVKTIREFDDKITAPLHGFKDAEDYYQQSSSRQYLKQIRVPTLIIHAKDDPLMSLDLIPTPDELSDAIQMELTEGGGHVGFVGGHPWNPRYWLDDRIPAFLAKHLS